MPSSDNGRRWVCSITSVDAASLVRSGRSMTPSLAGSAVLIVVLLLGCGPKSDVIDGVFMARGTHSSSDPGMTALLRGRLEVTDGCLVVRSTYLESESTVVIWAREFSLRRVDERLQLFDRDRPFASVGDTIDRGGGEVDAEHVAKVVRDQIPLECRRDKYFVGNVAKVALP